MKIGYFFIVCFFLMSLLIKSNIFDDVGSGRRSIFNDILQGGIKWWDSKSQEKKQAVYEATREAVYNAVPAEFVNERYVNSNANYFYDIIKGRLGTDLKKGAGVAAVGAGIYGLYRWLTRRGLGGITNDSRAIDRIFSALLQQIDKKISDLMVKKSLSTEDEQTAKALLLFIDNRIKAAKLGISNFKARKGQLKKILKPTINVFRQGKKVYQQPV